MWQALYVGALNTPVYEAGKTYEFTYRYNTII